MFRSTRKLPRFLRSPALTGTFVYRTRTNRSTGICTRICTRTLSHAYSSFAGTSDDALLRDVFDSQDLWKTVHSGSAKPTGLFQNDFLVSPQGLREFSEKSLQFAQELTMEIIQSREPSDLVKVVKNFDLLSDILCKVIDMVAFVRMTHPDKKMVYEAQRSHELMYDFMNMLNTSVELYQVLDLAFKDGRVYNQLSPEEKVVGKILLTDFERSGVNLDPVSRDAFVKLSSQVSVQGQEFLNNAGPEISSIDLQKDEILGLEPRLAERLRGGNSFGSRFTRSAPNYKIPTTGPISDYAVRNLKSESSRKKLWLAQRSAPDEQVDRLKSFLHDRAKLAQMMGYNSFAEYELRDKMAKTPANVVKFLKGIASETFPLAKAELDQLLALKLNDPSANNQTQQFQAWDRDYYSSQYLQLKQQKKTRNTEILSSYFSLGTVMQGLSRLFTRIYGIQFVPCETGNGEVWDDQVRRLNVVSESEGLLGVMYCDLFQREGKSPHPAHFTIQCSRQVSPEEPEFSKNHKTMVKSKTSGELYQLPIIVLVCDFARSNSEHGKCLLSVSELETLFHEMGHAIHSMLGRTKLHNVSGTRCVTDFVELPSVLMEHFATSPEVLGLYARHHATDEPLPMEVLKSHLKIQSCLDHSETYHQFLLSMLDQRLHSEMALTDDINPDDVYYQLEHEMGLFPAERGSRWFAQFGHLFGYGATYYCYLFDRAIADRIWSKVFAADPLSREAGEKFRSEVLAWGGSRDPWQCVSRVLDEPRLAEGDENCMMEIGKSIS